MELEGVDCGGDHLAALTMRRLGNWLFLRQLEPVQATDSHEGAPPSSSHGKGFTLAVSPGSNPSGMSGIQGYPGGERPQGSPVAVQRGDGKKDPTPGGAVPQGQGGGCRFPASPCLPAPDPGTP